MKRTLAAGSYQGAANGREKRFRAHSNGRNPFEGERPRKRNDEYTVGWICAVVTEYVAAQAVLDELHGRPESVSPANQTDYTLGRIGEHNVVLASLPFGEYGTASAATVAADMSHNFPNIQARLMVGIGGGAPSDRHDIRLGDVVVSAPRDGYGGVMQYDFGKNVQGQPFRTTRYLNQPPTFLRAVMGGLAADNIRRGHRIENVVAGIVQGNLRLRGKYSRPPESSDRLYSSTCVHPFNSNADCEISCGDSALEVRSPRAPGDSLVIHHGMIASANQLMKDASVRDQLSSQHNILCFEMEAGGLMNQFPCLVIRGICDYSDSHKNDAWQGYAAMTAAAYAKDLIMRLSPITSNSSQDTDNMNLSDQREISKTGPRTVSAEQKCRLLESLRFDQIDARQMTIKRAHAKTCQWLLRRSEYLDWLNQAKFQQHFGFLWIKGKPGTGKSTLMKFALQSAQRKRAGNVIIHFFFNARGEELEKSTLGLYRSLLLQLLERIPALQDTIQVPEAVARSGETYHWNTEVLTDLLEQAIQNLEGSNVLCFIDALDECEEDQIRNMIRFFEDVGEAITAGTFRICFSSRHYPHITISRGLDLVLEGQEGHTQDIISYIKSELRIGRESLAAQLRTEVGEKAGGVFMWVVLVVGILNKEYDSGRVNNLRERLQEIPKDLHQLFRDILTRDSHNTNELLLCLQWVLFAKQPLSPQQLYFALLSDKISEWNSKEITPDDMERYILDSSKGLTEQTKSLSSTVQFIHESVRDYLLKEDGLRQIWSDLGAKYVGESHDQLKRSCMKTLTFGHNAVGLEISDHLKETREARNARSAEANAKFPFLEYAVKNVLHHANEAQAGGVSQMDFLGRFGLVEWIRLDNFFQKHARRRHKESASMQYILAENNAGHLTKLYPAKSFLTKESERYGPPLFAALAVGSKESIRAILGAYVETEPSLRGLVEEYHRNETKQNSIGRGFKFRSVRALEVLSRRGATLAAVIYLALQHSGVGSNEHSREALRFAVLGGHASMVEYFIKNGANPQPESGESERLIRDAIDWQHDRVAELLLINWATFYSHGKESNSLMFIAVDGRYRSALKIALEKGAEVNIRDGDRLLLAHAVSQPYNEASVALLLEHGADVNAKDNQGRTPFSHAVSRHETEASVALLLEHGADVNAKDNQSRTPLSHAVSELYNKALVALLLEHGADVNAKDNQGRTPLSHALSRFDNYTSVALLLEHGADITAKDNQGRTPLSHASQTGEKAAVRALLEQGADIHAKDNNGRPPFSYAASSNDEDTTTLLLQSGAEVHVKDNSGRTPLSHASERDSVRCVRVLLDEGAEVEAKDNNGRSPLSYAASYGWYNNETVPLLLQRGAAADTKDNEGRTPLFYASQIGKERTVKLLLENNASVNHRDHHGRTSLSYASGCGHVDAIKELLDKGAEIDFRDCNGRTSLLYASISGHTTSAKLLLDRGAEVDAQDVYDRTPLSHAVENGCEEVVKVLLENSANINARDKHGITPLFYASISGYPTIVKLLLDKGADVHVTDDMGNTPLINASSFRDQETIRLLIERGADINARNCWGKTPLMTAKAQGLGIEIIEMLQKSSDN